jgi:hypothetical protein
LPHRIEKQHEYMEQHSEVGIIGGYLELFRGDHVLGVRKYPLTDSELRKCIFRYSPVAQPAAMVRMSALNKVGQYNLRYPPAEDLDMTFRIGYYYKLANLSEVVIKYRESDTSATFTRLRKMEMSTLEIRKNNFYSQGYHASLIDIVYNMLHFVSIWIIPPTLKIRLFNLFRNT